MQIVFVLFLVLFSNLLVADGFECSVDDRIMFAIAKVERHPKTPVGYPFLISINMKKDKVKAKKIQSLKKYFLDSRTLDCNSQEECVGVLHELNNHGITNLDCGAFQLNYKYWKMQRIADYFDTKKSYEKACSIVMSHNKSNWSWENIAKYHSKTKKYNTKYKKYLIATIEKEL